MTEDEMVGWYHRLNGHEFGSNLGLRGPEIKSPLCRGRKAVRVNGE